jgi:hypothetical protein
VLASFAAVIVDIGTGPRLWISVPVLLETPDVFRRELRPFDRQCQLVELTGELDPCGPENGSCTLLPKLLPNWVGSAGKETDGERLDSRNAPTSKRAV